MIKPPANKLVCKPEPAVPEEVTDATVAQFIVDLRGAGQDCRSQLQWVKDFYDAQ